MISNLHILTSQSQEPAYNLALEEYLLEQEKDYLLFYINRPSLIIGKHQNPWLETNVSFCARKGIPILRRMTGGGTVYHDFGNINFSYIRSKVEDYVDFKEHIMPFQKGLENMGIPAEINARNDLFLQERKISGNAEHVNSKQSRIIHHGTMLYDADLSDLSQSLAPEQHKIDSHAVKSVKSKVMNIREFKDKGNAKSFLNELITGIKEEIFFQNQENIEPNKLHEISALVNEKYNTWDWNFGHSPQFSFINHRGETFVVRKGHYIEVESDDLDKAFKDNLVGRKFHKSALSHLNLTNEEIKRICLPS